MWHIFLGHIELSCVLESIPDAQLAIFMETADIQPQPDTSGSASAGTFMACRDILCRGSFHKFVWNSGADEQTVASRFPQVNHAFYRIIWVQGLFS